MLSGTVLGMLNNFMKRISGFFIYSIEIHQIWPHTFDFLDNMDEAIANYC